MSKAMKRGLVLEGGAMRGLFTAGVLDVLMERGVKFDGIVGVSADACFGCNYKSGQIWRVIARHIARIHDARRHQLDRVGPDDPDSPVRVLVELDILNAYERIRSCYINMVETLAGRK